MSSQKIVLYNGVKGLLEEIQIPRIDTSKGVMRFKTIRLWRNDMEREKDEIPFLMPAALIELLPSNYMELSNGLQSYDLTLRIHIVFESYKDEDLDVLNLVDGVYRKLQGKQFGYLAKLKRRAEDQNFDHSNWQDYMQDYDCGKAKDFPTSDKVETTLTDVDVEAEIKIITE